MNFLKNIFSNTINQIRPPDPEPLIFDVNRGKTQPISVIPNRSPRWQKSTKQIIIIAIAILSIISLFFLRNLIAPILFALILVYLNQPIVNFIHKQTKLPWRLTVVLFYLLLLLLIIGLITWGGFALISQIQSLVDQLRIYAEDFPKIMDDYLSVSEKESPLRHNLGLFVDSDFGSQLTTHFQGISKSIATGLGSFVQSAASKLGWFFFILGFSFFILLESGTIRSTDFSITFEGYEFDLLMAKKQIVKIWNTFLRGQVILMIFTIFLYTIVFLILNLKYSFALALVVGIARIIPYIGSTFAFAAYAIIAYFQGDTIFHLSPLHYMILIVLIAFIIDKTMDGILTPKIMADTLKVHPAMVLLVAIICSRLLGFIGILLAAPIVATFKLTLIYLIRKLRDANPWENIEMVENETPFLTILSDIWKEIADRVRKLIQRIKSFFQSFRKEKDKPTTSQEGEKHEL